MNLYLHVTCSFICTFNSIYFDTFFVWYFSDCLPIFFSFFPSHFSCVMAAKHKSIPFQNPFCSEASSSSPFDPTPSHVWFCDEKAKSDFLENFPRRGIHSNCQVVLSDFSDTDPPTVIHSRGWESLCGVLVTCPSVFYLRLGYMHCSYSRDCLRGTTRP